MAPNQRCAPVNQCPNGSAVFHPVDYVECAQDGSHTRTCGGANGWGAPVNNPQPNNEYCGPVAQGGYSRGARCTAGVGGGYSVNCVSCEPFFASSTSACNTSCANDDGQCWTAYHCFSGDNLCYPDASGAGNRCDLGTECTSGRCAADGTCQDKVANGGLCVNAQDCINGTCNNGICCGGGTCCTAGTQAQCGSYACDVAANSCRTSCATNDDLKCQGAGFHCVANNNTCHPNTDGSPCDVPTECNGGICNAGACSSNSIARIYVSCTTTGGGGGSFRYGRVDVNGLPIQDVSGLSTSALYSTSTSPQNITLTTPIQNGWYFAVLGGEGSGALTCNFQFFNAGGGSLGSASVVPSASGGTDRIVRSGTGSGDIYTRFLFSGGSVTYSEQTTP